MIIIHYCKTQIVCLLILAYISLIYIKEGNQLKKIAKEYKSNVSS